MRYLESYHTQSYYERLMQHNIKPKPIANNSPKVPIKPVIMIHREQKGTKCHMEIIRDLEPNYRRI